MMRRVSVGTIAVLLSAGVAFASWYDDYNSGNYATDSRPPSPILDLRASSLGRATNLTWTAPGDDFHCGRADHYEVRASSTPITIPELVAQ